MDAVQYAPFPIIEIPVIKRQRIHEPLPSPPLVPVFEYKAEPIAEHNSTYEKQRAQLIQEIAEAKCTCFQSPLIHCRFEKNNSFTYYRIDMKKLQELTKRTFDHLCWIYSKVVKQPNDWFSRPQIGACCSENANKKTSSFLNALSSECKIVFNDPIAQPAVTELVDKKWPAEDAFLIGRKMKGRALYTFLYWSKSLPAL